jgi:hypothetical protein
MDHFTDATIQMAKFAMEQKLRHDAWSLGIQVDQYNYNTRMFEELKRKNMQRGAIEIETTIINEDDHSGTKRLPNNG